MLIGIYLKTPLKLILPTWGFFLNNMFNNLKLQHLVSKYTMTTSFVSRREKSTQMNNLFMINDISNVSLRLHNSPPPSSLIKVLHSLRNKKHRRKEKKTIIEGPRLITDILLSSHSWIRKSVTNILCTQERYSQLSSLLNTHTTCSIYLASESIVSSVCDTSTPQGIVAMIQIPHEYKDPSYLSENYVRANNTSRKLFLILDKLSDPGNLGSIIRSAVAVNIEAIILLSGCCDVWSPKVIRSSAGASFFIPMKFISTWKKCLDFLTIDCCLQSNHIYASRQQRHLKEIRNKVKDCISLDYTDVNWNPHTPMGLCIGNEGNGLRSCILNSIHKGEISSLHVPINNNSVDSLNASVCGSIILFEYNRQCNLS